MRVLTVSLLRRYRYLVPVLSVIGATFLFLSMTRLTSYPDRVGAGILELPGRLGSYEPAPELGDSLVADSLTCQAVQENLAFVVSDLIQISEALPPSVLRYKGQASSLDRVSLEWRSQMFLIKGRLFEARTCPDFETSRLKAIQLWRQVLKDGKLLIEKSRHHSELPDTGPVTLKSLALLSELELELRGPGP